eukprot:COSAG02_NODE_274_length_26244_cov_36.943507_25_plen_66_part_00
MHLTAPITHARARGAIKITKLLIGYMPRPAGGGALARTERTAPAARAAARTKCPRRDLVPHVSII